VSAQFEQTSAQLEETNLGLAAVSTSCDRLRYGMEQAQLERQQDMQTIMLHSQETIEAASRDNQRAFQQGLLQVQAEGQKGLENLANIRVG